MYKFLCLFVVLMILYLIQTKCNKEGFFSIKYKPKKCADDSTWFVENNDGKHHCSDIGKSVSCYDRDIIGREGWERCLKTCGNCANTKVTKAPMGVLAGFSGDPYEDFGVVLNMDADRQWVGKTASKDGKDDIRGYVMGKKQGEDIEDLQDRVDSVEDVFNMVLGNVKKCKADQGKPCTVAGQSGENGYKSCDGTCVACPASSTTTEKGKKRTYIKQQCDPKGNNCHIQFPAVELTCSDASDLSKVVKPPPLKNYKYEGCYAQEEQITTDNLEFTKLDKDYTCRQKGETGNNCVNVSGKPYEKIKKCAKICLGTYNGTLPKKGDTKTHDNPIKIVGYKNDVNECCTDKNLRGLGDETGSKYVCSHGKPGLTRYPPFSVNSNNADKSEWYTPYKLEILTKYNHPECHMENKCLSTDPDPTKAAHWITAYIAPTTGAREHFKGMKKFNGLDLKSGKRRNNGGDHGDQVHDEAWDRHNIADTSGRSEEGNSSNHKDARENAMKGNKKAPYSLGYVAKKFGKCYIMGKPKVEAHSNYMSIQGESQCRCGSEVKDDLKKVDDWGYRCGIDGVLQATQKQAHKGAASVFSLIKYPYDGSDAYDVFDKKTIPLKPYSKCENYFLFDKLSKQSDKTDTGKKDAKDSHKITLKDVCPHQCGVTQCKK